MANIKNIERIKNILADEGYSDFYLTDDSFNDCSAEVATQWNAVSWEEGYRSYRDKLPKNKPVTAEYILNRIARQQDRKSINYIKLFRKIPFLKGKTFAIYAASYGIGLEALFMDREDLKKKVSEWLKSNGIDFTTEYSEAGWVYRFKFSQNQENINQIKKVIG